MDPTCDSIISLNRLFFLPRKKLESGSPYFVIEFVAKSLGIKFDFTSGKWKETPDSLIDYVNDTLQEETYISMDKLETSLPDIALFVNPEMSVQWKSPKKLIDAFLSICNFTPKIPLNTTDSFGYKTEITPSNIDPVMVYQIATHYKIPISRETTLEKAQKDIRDYSEKLTPLRQRILSRIRDVLTNNNRKGLIDIRSYISDSPTSGRESFPDVYPKTYEEAVFRAAKEHRWDISMASNPIKEYMEIDRQSNDKYSPVDREWAKIFDINRRYFNLDSRYMHNHESLYTDSAKKSLLYLNGNSYKSNHLVLGIHPENPSTKDLDNFKTSISYEKIPSDTLERYNQLISTPDFIITREELYSLWDSKKCFVSPEKYSVELSDNHLDMIINNSEPKNDLRVLIERLRRDNSNIIYKSREVCDSSKLSIVYFRKLMSIGMAIRGYKTCYEDYPLAESNYDANKYQDLIEKRVVAKTAKLIHTAIDFFDKIPAFIGRNVLGEESEEYVVKLYGDDIKIGEILRRILSGDEFVGCIRNNSNLVLVTSWYYLTYLDESPFNIADLRFIS